MALRYSQGEKMERPSPGPKASAKASCGAEDRRDVDSVRLPSPQAATRGSMKRREFIAATAALLVSPRRSWAQGTPRRVGTLGNVQNLPIKKVFDESLRGHGWIEGKNLIIDYRYFEGHAERIPPLAAELVALKPDLLIATNTQTAVALKSATASIPIVFVAVADPVRLGLVQSLSHPGGNMTGLCTLRARKFHRQGGYKPCGKWFLPPRKLRSWSIRAIHFTG